jgi:hypothetical protein
LVEQRIENPRVDGSIPSQATTVAKNARKPQGFRAFFIGFRLHLAERC